MSGGILATVLAETSLHSNQCKPGRAELVLSVWLKAGRSNLQCGFFPERNLDHQVIVCLRLRSKEGNTLSVQKNTAKLPLLIT